MDDQKSSDGKIDEILDEMGVGESKANTGETAAPSRPYTPDQDTPSDIEDLLLPDTSVPEVEPPDLPAGRHGVGPPEPAATSTGVDPASTLEADVAEPPDAEPPAREVPRRAPAPAARTPMPEQPAPAPLPAPIPAAFAPARPPRLVVALLALAVVGLFSVAAAVFSLRPGASGDLAQLLPLLQSAMVDRTPKDSPPPSDYEEQLIEARRLFDSGLHDQALPLLQKLAAKLPSRPDILWMCGESAMQRSQWNVALEAFLKFTASFPGHADYAPGLIRLATCYRNLGFYGSARRTCYRLIGAAGRLTVEQQKLVPDAYLLVADCYGREAASIQAEGKEQHL